MAGLDYGLIPIIDGKLGFLSKLKTGAGNYYKIGNLEFYKLHASKIFVMSEDEDKVFIRFDDELDWKNKIVLYWEYKDTKFKTKKIAPQMYLTKFKHYGLQYVFIHGYDVDTEYCHANSKLRIIHKQMKKYIR